mmetsp:Transcript_7738/g.11757  ORF Transcript_7738/g.11757 Transcript_7738/m.11757 type:complete len:196 (-) Transcript_7738:191-778(-)
MGNSPPTPPTNRIMGDPYPGAADPYPVPSREDMITMVMQFTGVMDEGIVRRVLQDHHWDSNMASQFLLASGGLEVMEFTLPAGASPGRTVRVKTPRGECEVVVPAGLAGGDVMTFKLPIPTPPPEIPVARPVGSANAHTTPDVVYGFPSSQTYESHVQPEMGYSCYEPQVARPLSSNVAPAGTMPPPPGRQFRFL